MEYELKFRAEAAVQDKILQTIPGCREVFRMKTTYFDTPAGDFCARKWTLRCRQENGISLCALKTPGEGKGRGEWETPTAEIGKSIEMLCKLGAPEELKTLCAGGLIPVCGAEFTRTAVTLTFQGSCLEVALDQGVLTGGGRAAPIAEAEVELKSGSTAHADAFAAWLSREFGLEEEPYSKFRRALALYRGEENV